MMGLGILLLRNQSLFPFFQFRDFGTIILSQFNLIFNLRLIPHFCLVRYVVLPFFLDILHMLLKVPGILIIRNQIQLFFFFLDFVLLFQLRHILSNFISLALGIFETAFLGIFDSFSQIIFHISDFHPFFDQIILTVLFVIINGFFMIFCSLFDL